MLNVRVAVVLAATFVVSTQLVSCVSKAGSVVPVAHPVLCQLLIGEVTARVTAAETVAPGATVTLLAPFRVAETLNTTTAIC